MPITKPSKKVLEIKSILINIQSVCLSETPSKSNSHICAPPPPPPPQTHRPLSAVPLLRSSPGLEYDPTLLVCGRLIFSTRMMGNPSQTTIGMIVYRGSGFKITVLGSPSGTVYDNI